MIKSNQLRLFAYLLFAIIFTSCKTTSEESKKRPNIILIMADDMGFECIGSYGGTSYKTPNIDRLAETGIQFNQAYAPTTLYEHKGKIDDRKVQF